ncbi:GvpL/GvpF family gas vesicle protein [Streptomyces sp. SCA3-4]|uniref:GvpL/GvpF family gas vesicle protein n=1 Tax=Streptomyces sichuanensis TaxID=2871810 RepID=UPI001CE2C673|nr:GvpL/GvpF family gas vesicle protein [Streptomyces sichuanensis]MCA6093259.1 GvpL/GvpF family gas vesicle protein [Streptomyces sichuanensis]
MAGNLSYAYAVVPFSPSLERTALAGVQGVAGSPVTLVRSGEVAAAVSPVPEADFSQSALKAHLEDLDWLEPTARAHHSVVESLAAHTTVLPLRLATVYLDDLRVAEMLHEGHPVFAASLARLSGHAEWGVKVYVDAAAAPPPPAAAPPDAPDAGRAYLRQRRHQHQTRRDAWRLAEEVVRRIDAETRGLAAGRARHRPQQGRLAEASGENVANDAYLVPHDLAEEFRRRVHRAAEGSPGVRVDITGPWAPYSFADPGAPEGAPT